MPTLTRRRDLDAPDECWHVYFGDVRVGTIAKRIGVPFAEDPWGWACGFYPGCHPREQTHGAAATFDHARADFEEAWGGGSFKPNRGRLPGMVRPAGLNGTETRDVGGRREIAVPEAEFADEVPLRRDFR
jgi:hypothetical protein